MKKIFLLLLLIIICVFVCKNCADNDVVNTNLQFGENIEKKVVYPQDSKTVTIDGIDYLQSMAEVG